MERQYATVWNMSRLSREDWAQAGLEAIATGGVSAVSVEPLAARLGATKGSFYWHFSARDELVVAALALWEERSTTSVIAGLEATGASAKDRLSMLFCRVFDPETLTGADVSLLSHVGDPPVRDALNRVTAARIRYVAALLRECGLPPRTARRRAVFAYSAFLGHLHLRHSTPDLLRSSVGPVRRYAEEVIDALLVTDSPR